MVVVIVVTVEFDEKCEEFIWEWAQKKNVDEIMDDR